MTLNRKYFLLVLALFMVLLMGVSMASAADADVQGTIDTNKLSTPNNYDVDNMVQSSASPTSTDTNVEKITTSDKTNNTEIAINETDNTLNTSKDIITLNSTNKSIQKNLKTAGEGTFTQLYDLISSTESGGTVSLPGDYAFVQGTDDLYSDGIPITNPITINGNGFTINANYLARIFNITSTNVTINDITFTNANTSGDGGAILWTGSVGTIKNSRFYNNSADNRGGGIFLIGVDADNPCENVTVDNCTFIDNFAGFNGAGVDWSSNSQNGRLLNSTFINNTALRSGGALFWNGHNGTIENTVFENNKATGENQATHDFTGSVEYATPGGNGGAILWSGSVGYLNNVTIHNNSAAVNGGAAMFIGGINITVNNSNVTNNSAGNNGGGLDWREGASNGEVINSSFEGNDAGHDGGAIFWNGEYGEIKDSYFANNHALGDITGYDILSGQTNGGDGGAVIWTGSNGYITNSVFENNDAAYRGGSIYFTHHEGTGSCENVSVEGCNFTDNHAGLNGGALDWGVGAYNATISSSRFVRNVAERNGGAIYVSGHEGDILNSYFEENEAKGTVDKDDRDTSSTGPYGIYHVGGGYGGAILWTSSSTVSSDGFIDNCTFYKNDANISGGAVFLIHSINVTVNGSNFTENHAKNRGGALNFREGAENCSVKNSIFDKNIADGSAGAIYWNGEKGSIENSNFTENRAKGTNYTGQYPATNQTYGGDGGAVLWTGSNGEIRGSVFDNNDAAYRGGAIYFTHHDNEGSCENVSVDGCNFTDNHAGLNGGALDWGVGAYNATISSSRFIRNVAERNGGAIYVSGHEG
ncbi:MAG: hypothetical protein BZ136_02100, partial [Methanosphaera sp. rholeuAM74]